MKKKMNDQSLKIKNLEHSIEHQEQYSLKWNLLIFGLPENHNENCDDLVLNLAKSFGINWLNMSNFQRAHRLGRFNQNVGKPRPIVMRFISIRDKVQFIKDFINFNKPQYNHRLYC